MSKSLTHSVECIFIMGQKPCKCNKSMRKNMFWLRLTFQSQCWHKDFTHSGDKICVLKITGDSCSNVPSDSAPFFDAQTIKQKKSQRWRNSKPKSRCHFLLTHACSIHWFLGHTLQDPPNFMHERGTQKIILHIRMPIAIVIRNWGICSN